MTSILAPPVGHYLPIMNSLDDFFCSSSNFNIFLPKTSQAQNIGVPGLNICGFSEAVQVTALKKDVGIIIVRIGWSRERLQEKEGTREIRKDCCVIRMLGIMNGICAKERMYWFRIFVQVVR
ncbi:unnamed protein product [Amaranthus hypochondriacus]